LKNLKEGAWYPTGDDQWQQRAPYFIIAGTWNSGVNPLANALLMHPQINAANVHGFFLPRTFNRKFVTRTSKPPSMMLNNVTAADSSVENVNIQVFAARDRMYHAVYSPSSLRDTDSTAGSVNADNDASKRSKSKLVAMDISPGLLFYAHTTSPSVVCVSPWSKIVILLRNPVDRLYQQWVYSKTKLSLSLSLEDWVAREMKAMQSTGLIGDNAAAQESAIISERDAWNNYQSVSSSTGAALGRSMYVLQLHDWILTYLEAGKKPSEEIIIIASEELEENPTKKYAEVIGFLGLAPLNMTAADNSHDFGNAISKPVPPKGIDPMKKETRAMLEQFFRPYNKRLVKLLKEQGFEGEWEKIWK
jgi:N-acetylgalactosamine 4-sulfate 6-O-sulfotransferase